MCNAWCAAHAFFFKACLCASQAGVGASLSLWHAGGCARVRKRDLEGHARARAPLEAQHRRRETSRLLADAKAVARQLPRGACTASYARCAATCGACADEINVWTGTMRQLAQIRRRIARERAREAPDRHRGDSGKH